LADNPRPPGSVKLTGQDAYRVRVGDYRIIYTVHDEQLLVLVIDVGHRATSTAAANDRRHRRHGRRRGGQPPSLIGCGAFESNLGRLIASRAASVTRTRRRRRGGLRRSGGEP
jgi:hypothetical protein